MQIGRFAALSLAPYMYLQSNMQPVPALQVIYFICFLYSLIDFWNPWNVKRFSIRAEFY